MGTFRGARGPRGDDAVLYFLRVADCRDCPPSPPNFQISAPAERVDPADFCNKISHKQIRQSVNDHRHLGHLIAHFYMSWRLLRCLLDHDHRVVEMDAMYHPRIACSAVMGVKIRMDVIDHALTYFDEGR